MSESTKSLARAPRLGRHCSRAALQAAAVLLAALVLSVAASARVPGRGADLVETRSGTAAQVVAGGSFELADTVTNRGRALAGRSVTRYYLRSGRASMSSRAACRRSGRRQLEQALEAADAFRRAARTLCDRGSRRRSARGPRVDRGEQLSWRTSTACRDGTDRRRRRPQRRLRARTGTRAASWFGRHRRRRVSGQRRLLAARPQCPPGRPDLPDPQFVDSNCDGIDGTAAGAIFVSPIGDDAEPGHADRAEADVRGGYARRRGCGKDVCATLGTYTERLDLQNGVSVYGAYSSDWTTRGMGVTRVTGVAEASSTVGAVAVGIERADDAAVRDARAGRSATAGRQLVRPARR